MKGIVLTLDAIIALTIMVSVVSLLILFRTDSSSPFYTAQQLHSLSEDTMTIMSESTLEEVVTNKTLLYNLNQSGLISEDDFNKKAIDIIGTLWSENNTSTDMAAADLTKDILGNILPPNVGYQVLVNGYNVYNSSGTNRTKYEDATTEISSNRIASGYQKGENVTGCVARAYLKSMSKNDSSYLYFGGYVGDGNITVNITLPPLDRILEAYMELDDGGNFNLYVNDNYAGNYSNGTAGGGLMRADKWVVCNTTYNYSICSNFTQGNNTLKFNFTGNTSFIGGGYFRVTYNTTQLAPAQELGNDTYWFPGIAGFFNLYDSMYIPGTLINMTSYLHYFNNFTLNQTNATVYLSIGNVAVFRSNETGEINKTLNFSDIWKNFSSSQSLINNISNKTVPLRFGIEGFQLKPGVGTADAVLITDVSGSMGTFEVSCPQDVAWRISALDCKGNYSAQNRKIDDSQSACMYRNVTLSSSGKIYFQWKVSSQSNRDYLNFYIDGSRQSRISGNINWATVNYAISSGTHEIRWCYTKDNSGSSNDDTGYVDSIVVNNTAGTVFFSDNFESGVLNGWSFYSSGTTCEKLDSAKIVDKTFVDTVLDTVGDRTGLVSFESTLSGTHPLNNNSCTLKGNITAYSYGGSTCTSCGISNATIILDAAKNPLRFQGLLLMSDGYANQCLNGNWCGVFGGPVDGSAASPDPNYPAKLEAINMSCTARDKNYTVFSVGFGSSADSFTLQRIACWNCSACRLDCSNFTFQSSCPSQTCYWNSTDLVNFTAFDSTFDSVSTSTNCSGVTNDGWTDCVAGGSKVYWRAVSTNGLGTIANSSSAEFFRGDNITTANATYITKCLDLSPYTKAYLSFYWNISLNYPSEYILVRANKTGSPNLKDLWYSGNGNSNWAHTEMDVTNYISSNTCFRIYCTLANSTNQYCDLDDFKIIGTTGKCEILNDSSCWIGNVTNPLDGTQADCRDVRYAQSDDLDQLTQIYQGFGQMFVNLGYTTQRANISSNMKVNNILYPDSHIDLQYSPVIIPSQYGEVSLTVESPRLGDLTDYNITKPYKEGWFNISDKVRVVDAEMTSYSSDYWTDMLWLNSSATGGWKEVYNLTYWGIDYTVLGDPFIIHLPVNNISSGNNSVRIETGLCPNNSAICKLNKTGGSPDDRVIYTIRVNGSVGYGSVNETCPNAINDAIQRLKNLLGSFSITGDIEAETGSISSVPYIWGPASIKVSVWS